MRNSILAYLPLCMIGIISSMLVAQLLPEEIEPLILGKLRWQMTTAEVTDCLGRNVKVRTLSDTTMEYDDIVFGAKAKTVTAFDKVSQRLKTVNVKFDEGNEKLFQTIHEVLRQRYGVPHDSKKKEEKKIIGTFVVELIVWKTELTTITLIYATFGGKSAGLTIAFLDRSVETGVGKNQ